LEEVRRRGGHTIQRSSFGSVERRSAVMGGAWASFATVMLQRQHQLDRTSRWSEASLTSVDEQHVDLQVPAFLAWPRAREEERMQLQLPIVLGTAHIVSECRRARKLKTRETCGRSGASFISASRSGIEGPCAPPKKRRLPVDAVPTSPTYPFQRLQFISRTSIARRISARSDQSNLPVAGQERGERGA
jgi:hypothetical protein